MFKKHGGYKTKIYNTWRGMKSRCNNPNNKKYDRYGGRGITVCDEWYNFEPFYKWSLANGWQDGLSLDRIENDGNYEPSNCKWATLSEQQNNTSKTIFVTIGETTDTLIGWSNRTGLKLETIRKRYKMGWRGEKLIMEVKKHGK